MTRDELVKLILEEGATKAEYITAEQVKTDTMFRTICAQNSCGKYNRCYMCPPSVGEIGPCMEKVHTYRGGVLYQIIGEIEDSYDIEGMGVVGAEFAQLSQRIRKRIMGSLQPGYLQLSSGGCGLCEKCAQIDGKPCRHPAEALPSMESYGIDVYNTTKDTHLKYINGQNTVTFFGIVLSDEI